MAVDIAYRVWEYCSSYIGRKVGTGECAELTVKACDYARARYNLKGGGNQDYEWGTLIARLSKVGNGPLSYQTNGTQIVRGCMVQYRNCTFKYKVGNTTYTKTATQHTSVINSVLDAKNGVYRLLQQNSNSKRYVTADGDLHLFALVSGTVWVYSPRAK